MGHVYTVQCSVCVFADLFSEKTSVATTSEEPESEVREVYNIMQTNQEDYIPELIDQDDDYNDKEDEEELTTKKRKSPKKQHVKSGLMKR